MRTSIASVVVTAAVPMNMYLNAGPTRFSSLTSGTIIGGTRNPMAMPAYWIEGSISKDQLYPYPSTLLLGLIRLRLSYLVHSPALSRVSSAAWGPCDCAKDYYGRRYVNANALRPFAVAANLSPRSVLVCVSISSSFHGDIYIPDFRIPRLHML